VVPGWNDYVADKYDVAQVAFRECVYAARRSLGLVFCSWTCVNQEPHVN